MRGRTHECVCVLVVITFGYLVTLTWISFRSLSWRFCSGSMKFCFTSMSRASFTSPSSFMASPASMSARPRWGENQGEVKKDEGEENDEDDEDSDDKHKMRMIRRMSVRMVLG